jgi:prepilin-type N-terminal cleavage/methylation domain-containing protein
MRQSARGVTLIELLVAITLAGLVAVLGALVLRAAIDFHGRATNHLSDGEHLRVADRLLLREWSGRSEQDLVAVADMVEFRTARLAGIAVEGVAKVRYLCTENESGQPALERQLLAPADGGQPGGGTAGQGAPGAPAWRVLQSEVLLPKLAGCSFSYLRARETRDAKIAQWTARWAAEAGTAQQAPRLLRLNLATERGEVAPLVYGVEG